jgi:multidrug efflux pump subunit AcrB
VFSENGGTSIALSVQAVKNVSVLEVMEKLKQEVEALSQTVLKQNGLEIIQVYDETVYIDQAIDQVYSNLVLGISLAIFVLWWFMRRFKAILIVALCIPLTLFGAFILIGVADRTINVISLAGLALAAGLSLDAAIVVFENVVRHFQKNGDRQRASMVATRQVTGALIASTLTTIAIFIPIIFTEDTTSQLFSDLAIAITATVLISLVVSITVIPAMMVHMSKTSKSFTFTDRYADTWQKWTNIVLKVTDTRRAQWFWLVSLVTGAIALSWLLIPKVDYLPQGNQNSIFAYISPPPGVSPEVAHHELEKTIIERMQPYYDREKAPFVNNYWLGFYGRYGFLGATPGASAEVEDLINLINTEILKDLPDVRAYASRSSIFGRFSGGRAIDMDIQGINSDNLIEVANLGVSKIQAALPGASVRPVPGLAFDEPEFRLVPNDRKLSEAGWDRFELGKLLNTLGDGLWLGEYFSGDQRLDIRMTSANHQTPEQIMNYPVVVANGEITTIGQLAEGKEMVGAATIRRVNGARTITLRVSPPKDMSLEQAINKIKQDVEPQLKPSMAPDTHVVYNGTAASLSTALISMAKNVLLAILILYLVIAALFSSFKDSLYVVLTIPLAAVGGFLAIRITNVFIFQPLDLLTMIGFVILLGMVVNNAILLVTEIRREQAANHCDLKQAIGLGLLNRTRPILMTTLTTVFGMLPLLFIPGEGSELYRGLAAIVIGGMLANVIFTFILVPTLMQLFEGKTAHGATSNMPATVTTSPSV